MQYMRKKRLTPKEASARSIMAAVSNTDNKVVENTINKNVIVQYSEKEIDMNVVAKEIENNLKLENVEVKELKMYVKPEDNAVYYVVNGDITGKYDI